MLFVILKTVVLSVVFIFVVHQIIYFLTDSLTIPKTKDLVSIIEKKYDEIHKTLQDAPRITPDTTIHTTNSPNTTNLSDLPIHNIDMDTTNPMINFENPSQIPGDISDMKSELQLFIN
jgi:hypothetical protein